MRRSGLGLVFVAMVAGAGAPLGAQGGAAPLKVGAYSLAQAAKGDTVHQKLCARCHTLTDHTNPDFRQAWFGQTVSSLFTYVRTTMPDDKPGELSEQDYLDVTAYILKLNGVSAGSSAMVNDTTIMKKFKIEVADTTGKGGNRP